jgi:hypothetical protein
MAVSRRVAYLAPKSTFGAEDMAFSFSTLKLGLT